MKLQYPAPTLSIPPDGVAKVVASALKKKHWHHFKTGTIKLVYTPVWIFTYDVFFEEGGVIVGESSGRVALDAVTGKLWEQIPAVLEEMPVDVSKETKHEYQCEVLEPVLSKEEAMELASLKLSALLKVPKQNVKIVGGQMMYWPMWLVWVEVREGTFRLDVDGVSGMVFGTEKVPEKEPGFYDITQEVLNELKTPSGWVKNINALADFLHIPRPIFWLIIAGVIVYILLSVLG